MKQIYTSYFLPLEGGVWVLKDKFGKILIPSNMPSSLKHPHCKSECLLRPDINAVSIYQIGDIVKILSYKMM